MKQTRAAHYPALVPFAARHVLPLLLSAAWMFGCAGTQATPGTAAVAESGVRLVAPFDRARPVDGRVDERVAEASTAGATAPAGARAPVRPGSTQVADAVAPVMVATSSGAPHLSLGASRLALPAGRSIVRVDLPAGQMVSLAVLGEQHALLGFDLAGPAVASRVRANGSLDEDGLLPRVVSMRAPPDATSLTVIVDAGSPVTLARVVADPSRVDTPAAKALRLGEAQARTLVGLPAPSGLDDGYMLQSPGRYQFVRVDVALSLLAALRQTRVRFRRDAIAVADCTQWDGARPATDLGRPRHISHDGGRDVDLALPADDESASTVRTHCSGVLVEQDVQGCAPGTARGVDSQRLAYLLGLLIEGYTGATKPQPGPTRPPPPRVERIYTDDVYVREIRRAADKLRERGWIKDFAYEALLDEGLLRPSHWHTDHVHVRFTGEPGRAQF